VGIDIEINKGSEKSMKRKQSGYLSIVVLMIIVFAMGVCRKVT